MPIAPASKRVLDREVDAPDEVVRSVVGGGRDGVHVGAGAAVFPVPAILVVLLGRGDLRRRRRQRRGARIVERHLVAARLRRRRRNCSRRMVGFACSMALLILMLNQSAENENPGNWVGVSTIPRVVVSEVSGFRFGITQQVPGARVAAIAATRRGAVPEGAARGDDLRVIQLAEVGRAGVARLAAAEAYTLDGLPDQRSLPGRQIMREGLADVVVERVDARGLQPVLVAGLASRQVERQADARTERPSASGMLVSRYASFTFTVPPNDWPNWVG